MSKNNHVVMIVGKVSKGKSFSLKYLKKPETVAYFNGDVVRKVLKPLL